MGTLRIIQPDGTVSDLGYEGKEPPLEMLQVIVGGYVEHGVIDYENKRRSVYVVDPYGRLHVTSTRTRASILTPNQLASLMVGQGICGTLIIDLGEK